MEPRYSILYFRQTLSQKKEELRTCLNRGIKVFWFGTREDAAVLSEEFASFCGAFFLQVFSLDKNEAHDYESNSYERNRCVWEEHEPARIIDGAGIITDPDTQALLSVLEKQVPAFNAAQYRVEHCQSDEHIMVKASAGTGKTTVMMDRILYLLHMDPELTMSRICMVTFTNDAADQMKERLQALLLKKYALTKQKRYLTWLEAQSQMQISTIDSLIYDLFRRYGTDAGFGRDLKISSMEKERKDLIRDLLSSALSEETNISTQIGMSFPEAAGLMDQYLKTMTTRGISSGDLLSTDWGAPETGAAAGFREALKKVLSGFEEAYLKLKREANAVAIRDLVFDFGRYLKSGQIFPGGLGIRYLFVDEFQDTDAMQISIFAKLAKELSAYLFAVGDDKQSIYSFKGAAGAAFDRLEAELGCRIRTFELQNNYRTCGNVMQVMERYFKAWAEEGLLAYEKPVQPLNQKRGTVQMEFMRSKHTLDEQTMTAIDQALADLELEIRSGRQKPSAKSRVAVLVRGNRKAAQLAALCRSRGKTVVLSSDRPFFLSEAVRDFYAMICSHLFPDQPIYLYQYLMTPYASYEGTISIAEAERRSGDPKKLKEYLNGYLKQTNWHQYQREFRLRPVLSVIYELTKQKELFANYIAADKSRMYGENWTETKRDRQAGIDVKCYEANLKKLMEMLGQRVNIAELTLYDLYLYLTRMIASNREEMEPDPPGASAEDSSSVYIMTVHKSKGLEYDTVILPAMNGALIKPQKSQILTDGTRTAWYYKGKNGSMQSRYYDALREAAVRKEMEEETRMLYVAMTRAINHLVLIVNSWDTYESWSSLIRRVGLIDE